MMQKTNLLPRDGESFMFRDFFTVEESNFYFQNLVSKTLWKQEAISMFGKKVMQPRLTACYGDREKSVRYSGITMKPCDWTPALLNIKQRIEGVAGVTFTSALLNYYRNEKDSMGWHRDNEKELGMNPVIGSVSFGAPRVFQMRHYYDKKLKQSIDLTHGSFLLMRGPTQHFWEHSLPKRAKALGSRVNITFRVVHF
jgi:alkylated DNA repair dioxygenase AlkB